MATKAGTDVIVVGAGILGLAHAYRAYQQGLSVRILERDSRPNGASIRNFGHCCITAQGDELLEVSLASRAGWLEAAQDVGFWAPEAGTYVVARSANERAVLEQLAEHLGRERVELLTRSQLEAGVGAPALTPAAVGGAFLPLDLRVDARTAPQEIADWLQSREGVSIEWNTTVYSAQDGVVDTSRGEYEAEAVYVCVNHDVDRLYPQIAETWQIRRCALQMALADPVPGWSLDSAVLTGTSLLRYTGFTEMPASAVVAEEIRGHSPQLEEIDANVMFTQRPDGGVILGDSHVTGTTLSPFLEEGVSDLLFDEISAMVGTKLRLAQRWQGVYAKSPLTNVVDEQIDSRVRSITVTSGIGMTLSFGLAARTFG